MRSKARSTCATLQITVSDCSSSYLRGSELRISIHLSYVVLVVNGTEVAMYFYTLVATLDRNEEAYGIISWPFHPSVDHISHTNCWPAETCAHARDFRHLRRDTCRAKAYSFKALHDRGDSTQSAVSLRTLRGAWRAPRRPCDPKIGGWSITMCSTHGIH